MHIKNALSARDFAKELLVKAILQRASDIHLEPWAENFRLRFRIDGLLYEFCELANEEAYNLINHLKILAELDIAEHRFPQDGQFSFSHHALNKECRLSTCPTLYGEKLVLRLLENYSDLLSLEELGFEQTALELFLKALNKNQGLILVTGPTGSGKSISLYQALSLLNKSTRHIISIEDPVEIKLPGITQVNVNPKIGLSFASALRTFLRQDPDVIMLGEIRDLETAEMVIKAAQTGHLVLSTLHTNDAISSITRLLNLGVPAFHIADTLKLVVAQRLIRKVCNFCQHQGCEQCKEGYKGRIGLYEVLKITPEIQEAITEKFSGTELLKIALAQGFEDLSMAAQHKLKQGVSTLEEINRVIH